jgi:hypothetical protein
MYVVFVSSDLGVRSLRYLPPGQSRNITQRCYVAQSRPSGQG